MVRDAIDPERFEKVRELLSMQERDATVMERRVLALFPDIFKKIVPSRI